MNAPRLAEIFNVGTSFVYGEKTYTFKEATNLQRAEFSEWVQEQAILFLKRKKDKGILTEAEYSESVAALAKNAGEFEFEGAACLKALGEPPGAIQFIYIMLREEFPEVDEDTARGIYQAKIQQVQEGIQKVRNDPKALKELEDLIIGRKSSSSYATARKTQSPSKRSKGKPRRK